MVVLCVEWMGEGGCGGTVEGEGGGGWSVDVWHGWGLNLNSFHPNCGPPQVKGMKYALHCPPEAAVCVECCVVGNLAMST